jgi:hypothetical protein
MHILSRFALSAGFVVLASSAALAQSPPTNVRGTIEKVDGNMLTVKPRSGGADVMVKLADNAAVRGVVKISMSEVKKGGFVGIAAMPEADGSQRAMEVLVFPAGLTPGEGHRPWDLQPNSTMTNAFVDQMVTGNDGQTLTVKYKDGEKKIVVPPDTPIVTFVQGDRSELKPGAKIVIIGGKKGADGIVEAPGVNVGRDGLMPPM